MTKFAFLFDYTTLPGSQYTHNGDMIAKIETAPTIAADNEWSTLRAVVVGRGEHACFPNEPANMIRATMPTDFQSEFKHLNPFPAHIVKAATQELDDFAKALGERGIRVYRPRLIDWRVQQGYTGAMVRDGLLSIGNTLIEAPFAWGCRRDEINLALGDFLNEMEQNGSNKIVRAPKNSKSGAIYRETHWDEHSNNWAINNTRPAFDAADFMRFGKLILGQLSNVTNMKGVEYLQAAVPAGYEVELLEVNDPGAMHIDATILPLRDGLLIYNPLRTTKAAIRKHKALGDWECQACPMPRARQEGEPPLFMTSNWLMMNILSIDAKTAVVEESDDEFAEWLGSLGIETIKLPFKNVHSIGGSFHCATVDLVRD